MPFAQLVDEFATTKKLPAKWGVRRERAPSGGVCLALDDAAALARFVAFVKHRADQLGREVFLRGQVDDFPGMVPGLFRDADDDSCEARGRAYDAVLTRIVELFGHGRFRRSDLGALLQHYGLRTPWLDLVDNIYTAAWFATNRYCRDQRGGGHYSRSAERYGWLYLIATGHQNHSRLFCVDLRKHHSSMCLRLHAQHGLSAATQHDGAPIEHFDYGQHVVARVRIPNDTRFIVSGALASPRFFFPSAHLDESYALLRSERLSGLLARAEREYGLPESTLGRVERVWYRTGRVRPAEV
jgi:hypothetical protein